MSLPPTQGQQAQSSAAGIDGYQRAPFQFGAHLSKCPNDLITDRLRTDVAGANLDDAWFSAAGCRKYASEIQIVREDDKIVSSRVVHDLCI